MFRRFLRGGSVDSALASDFSSFALVAELCSGSAGTASVLLWDSSATVLPGRDVLRRLRRGGSVPVERSSD